MFVGEFFCENRHLAWRFSEIFDCQDLKVKLSMLFLNQLKWRKFCVALLACVILEKNYSKTINSSDKSLLSPNWKKHFNFSKVWLYLKHPSHRKTISLWNDEKICKIVSENPIYFPILIIKVTIANKWIFGLKWKDPI